jgi:nitroreductase
MVYPFQRQEDEAMQQAARSFYEHLDRRRTVRHFSTDPIPEGVLEDCIRAASTAPSGAHKQPWFFAVIKSAELKQKVREAAEAEERENYDRRFTEVWKRDLEPFRTNAVKEHITDAPAIVVLLKQNYSMVDGEREKNYYVNESVGIAAGMFIAAVHNAGLVTLTHTPNPMGFLTEILERPKGEVPMLLLPVGYPAEGAEVPVLERKPLEAIMKEY